MPATSHDLLYVGIRRSVLALDASTGDLVWEAELGGVMSSTGVLTVHADGGRVYAASAGEVHCLDARTGAVVWHNELTRYGVGFAALATAGAAAGGGAVAAAAAAAQAARSTASSGG
jgi:outer membrane protein assembly factor BamB